MGERDDTSEMFHQLRRRLIDHQAARLTAALGGDLDQPATRAVREIAAGCDPDTVDALVTVIAARCAASGGTDE